MATSSTSGVVVSHSASNLKCSICLELFSDPRVIPCLHTYCLKCLQDLVSDQKSELSCPQCRVKHKIPNGGVDSYLSDLSILPELEVAKATTETEQTKICDFCITGEVAVSFCNECSEYLCEYCKGMHKRGKRSSTHTVTLLEEATLFSSLNVIKQDPYCSQHPDYKLEIFCKTCDTLVCPMCMLETTHKGHNYDFVKNVQDELMKRIKLMTKSVGKKEKEFKSCLVSVEKFEQQVCNQRDKLETEINAACDEYITKIQAMKEELLKQVESKFTDDCMTIWAIKDHLEVTLSQAESCQAFSERYQKQSNEGQMLPLLNQLLHCLKDLNNTVVNLSAVLSITTPRTKFEKTFLTLKSLSLGELSVLQNMEYIIQSGSCQKYTVKLSQKTKFIYLLNEPLVQPVKWKCKYGRNNNLRSICPVVVVDNNQLLIEFTPTLPGEYSFQLVPTKCSVVQRVMPFTVTVDHVESSDLIGAQVKRGPDWRYDDHDGGAGSLGTIVVCKRTWRGDYCIDVLWDSKKSLFVGYSWGIEGKYDLELVLK